MNLTSFKDLVALFIRRDIPHRAIVGQDAVELTTDHDPVRVRWIAEAGLIEAKLVLPLLVPDERMAAVEHLICVLNHQLGIPGLALDHARREVYYRLVVPRHVDGNFSEEEVRRLIATVVSTAGDMLPHVERVLH